jgi:hypothetical protein
MTECLNAAPLSADDGIRQMRAAIHQWFMTDSADPMDVLVAMTGVLLRVQLDPVTALPQVE